MKILIKNATIVNEGKVFKGSVITENDCVDDIFEYNRLPENIYADKIIDAEDLILIPGVIDDQVHFREPGATHKADIFTESRAALVGGVTSFMDMPNNIPPATTIENLEKKYAIASEKSAINYSFYMGATNNNIDEIKNVDAASVCGVKIFMGSSTGNMLVDDDNALELIFANSPTIIATHCEDENTIKQNTAFYTNKFGIKIPFSYHCKIRNSEACIKSTQKAVDLAKRHNSKLHILHISTAEEIKIIEDAKRNNSITAETCVHYLWFSEKDYNKLQGKIKCNPAIKSENDKNAIIEAVKTGAIDVIATDHAPHLIDEKNKPYLQCPSGLPLVQHSVVLMLELVKKNIIAIETVVERMCHAPAKIFGINKRGFIRKGYKADLVLINPNLEQTVKRENIMYKCGWSPFEGYCFGSTVTHTFINGNIAYENKKINDNIRGERLTFSR